MLDGAEIPQARTTIVKDFFATFERTIDIPGQKLLQNRMADMVVEEPIVAAVKGPNTAEE